MTLLWGVNWGISPKPKGPSFNPGLILILIRYNMFMYSPIQVSRVSNIKNLAFISIDILCIHIHMSPTKLWYIIAADRQVYNITVDNHSIKLHLFTELFHKYFCK